MLCDAVYSKEAFNRILTLLDLNRYDAHHDLKVKLAMADNMAYSDMDEELLGMMVDMINTIINDRYRLLKSGVAGQGQSHGQSGIGQELVMSLKP